MLGMAAAMLAFALVVPGLANAGPGALQPGDDLIPITNITLNGERLVPLSSCTLSFVFDGTGPLAGKVYFSTAAHCVDHVGQVVSSAGYPSFGKVAFLGDAGGDGVGGAGPERDFALIEVFPQFHADVRADVIGHPTAPSGVATPADTHRGDIVRMSGWGLAWTQTFVTREQRVGYLMHHDDTIVEFVGPVMQGDSGGPWFTDDGLALGIASQIAASIPTVIGVDEGFPYYRGGYRNHGPTISNLIADAASNGFPVELRTV